MPRSSDLAPSPEAQNVPTPCHFENARRSLRPALIEAIRALVEGTTLPMREIAARVGVSRSTLNRLTARQGWRRPRPARVSLAGRRGGGAKIVPEAVEAARALLEGSALSYRAIAARTGIATTTLSRWRKRQGWRRPPEAPTFLPGPRADGRSRPPRYRRQRGQPYAADAVGQAQVLLTQTALSQKAIAKQIGVSQWWVSATLRRHGWVRPPLPVRRGFTAGRRTGPLATGGDRRGRPYDPQVKREARAMWELSRLPTFAIGRRLGCHAGTVARWAKAEGWVRPRGRLGRPQLRGYFGTLRRQG